VSLEEFAVGEVKYPSVTAVAVYDSYIDQSPISRGRLRESAYSNGRSRH